MNGTWLLSPMEKTTTNAHIKATCSTVRILIKATSKVQNNEMQSSKEKLGFLHFIQSFLFAILGSRCENNLFRFLKKCKLYLIIKSSCKHTISKASFNSVIASIVPAFKIYIFSLNVTIWVPKLTKKKKLTSNFSNTALYSIPHSERGQEAKTSGIGKLGQIVKQQFATIIYRYKMTQYVTYFI